MGKEISFIYSLSPDLRDRLRVSALKEKGKIISFVVQYEALFKSRWYPIVRYDTSHGFAHRDIIHYSGRKKNNPCISQTIILLLHLQYRILSPYGDGIE